jgi:hypothetical protein
MRHGMIATLFLLLGIFAFAPSAHAAGKGQTKIDFKVNADGGSRIFAKRDVKAGVDQLAEVGSKSKNDNLAGLTVTFYIGSASFSGVANEKGKVVSPPFDAKITGNGKGMQVKANDLNLVSLFPLDMTDTTGGKGKPADRSVSVQIKITASKIDPVTQVETVVTLSDENVTFYYKVKNGAAKGKNF